MKNMRIVTAIFLALAMAVFSVGNLCAEEQPAATPTAPAAAAPAPEVAPAVTGSAVFSVFNRYIFRGYELSSHSAVFQPALTINYAGFSANLWSNIDSSEHATQSFAPVVTGRGHNNYNETDLTLNYTFNIIDKLALTGGFVYYGTEYAPETEELYLSATYDMFAHPTLAIYRDINHYPGTYLNLSFSQSLPVFKVASGDVTLDLGASFGYEAGSSNYWNTYTANKGNVGGKYSAFHDGMVKAGFTVPVSKLFSFQPIAQYWFPLSGDASRTITDRSGINQFNPNGHLDQTFVFGLNLNFNF
jgi:hypothetical protein